ncbi:putative signal transduction protein with EAL and GGDEF domain [Bradyrhizobium niftali]
MSAPYEIDGNEVMIAAFIGIALSRDDGATTEELMRNADTALYRANRRARRSPLLRARNGSPGAKAQQKELDLLRAFTNGEFELRYEPLNTGRQEFKLRGAAALARSGKKHDLRRSSFPWPRTSG